MNNLGILSKEEKQKTCWNEKSMSGSRFKKWCLAPRTWNVEEEFGEITRRKIQWGIKLEPIIREWFREILVDQTAFIIDKNFDHHETFQNKEFPFAYANIDGLLKNNGSAILEIKNTDMPSLYHLFYEYKYQLMYYSWFWKIQTICLVGFIRGSKLEHQFYTFNDDDWEFVEKKLNEFKIFIESGKLPEEEGHAISSAKEIEDKIIWLVNNQQRIVHEELLYKEYQLEIKNWMLNKKIDSLLKPDLKINFRIETKSGAVRFDKKILSKFFELNKIDENLFKKQGGAQKTLKVDTWN